MQPFEYHSATSVEDALAGLARDVSATRLLAGGTDLLTLMKADIDVPRHLVDIKRTAGLDARIEAHDGGLRLGALTTLSAVAAHQAVRAHYPALAEAAEVAASPQIRNMATLGGNLLQRPRCWYFRHPLVTCWLQGGDECQARTGENRLHALFATGPCVAIHPSDLATALVALEARVAIRNRASERTVLLDTFLAEPTAARRTEHTLGPDELILAVHLPAATAGLRSTYLKAMDRKTWSFALVGVAAVLEFDGTRIGSTRLALGGVAPGPRRLPEVEALLDGEQPSPQLFERAAETALAGAQPLDHNAYKVPLAKAMVRRALQQLLQ
jgi:xanthine dehydrogenase YagS FAD-binding subunit